MYTNFPNGITSFGAPVVPSLNGLPLSGKIFYVNGQSGQGADGNDGTPESPLATLPGALARCTAGAGDIVALMSNGQSTGSARLSDTLAWNKDNTHLIGCGAPTNVAQRSRISPTAGVAVFTPMVQVTADGCMFANLSTFYGFADNSAQVCWLDQGERNYYGRVNFGAFGAQLAADHAGSRALVLGAAGAGRGEHLLEDCTFGVDTVDRGAANGSVEILGGSPRITMRGCLFTMRADANSPFHVIVGAGGIDRYLLLDGCIMNNFGTTLTLGMSINAAPGGNVIWRNSTMVGATDIATAGRIFVDGAAPTADTSGIALPNT